MIRFGDVPCRDFHTENLELHVRMLTIAHALLDLALRAKILAVPERRAFVLALRHEFAPTPFFVSKVGYEFPDGGFRANCFDYAPEKIARALEHGHCTSYSTRDEITKWGGGIWLNIHGLRWGTGVSGLREMEDEAFGIVTNMYTFSIPLYTKEMYAVIDASNNTFIDTLLQLANDEIGRP